MTQILTDLQQSPIDTRDKIANLQLLPILPTSVDLKADVTEVEDQSTFNACTANAGCSALELMYKKNGTLVNLSRMYLYYYTRQLSNIVGDGGAYPRNIGKALQTYGVCYEPTWPYVAADISTAPSASAITEAAPFKITSYEQIIGDVLPQIKNAVAQGIPVLLTMTVNQSFMSLSGVWTTHTWDTSAASPSLGSHEVLVIGYDDAAGRLLIENSWGPAWADGGFFGMPYQMVTAGIATEFWILTPALQQQLPPQPITPAPVVPPTPVVPKPSTTSDSTNIIIAVVFILALIFFAMHH